MPTAPSSRGSSGRTSRVSVSYRLMVRTEGGPYAIVTA
jgi:hypothetical protein